MLSRSLSVLMMLAVASAALGQAAPPATRPADAAAQVPVQRIVLFSSGVGFFHHEGKVNGNAMAELRFQTQQINDVLKSLVVLDRGGGKIKNVTYPSQDPLSKTLKSFQIDISDNPTMHELLQQVRGTTVTVTLADQSITGTVLGVQKKERPAGKDDDKVIEVWQVNLLTPTGIKTVMLDDVTNISLHDAALREELAQALAAVAQARDKDKKPVQVHFAGDGERQVGMGYIIETPVWKTTYRLVLPEGAADGQKAANGEAKAAGEKPAEARLQGWAIVENQTDNDWANVQLSLVGGRPISFIEELYSPLYNPRPVVQPQLAVSLKPQTYEGGVEGQKDKLVLRGESREMAKRMGGARPPSMNLQEVTRSDLAAGETGPAGVFADATLAEDMMRSVDAVASGAKVGEMFQYAIDSVSLPRQKSAMLPIVTAPVGAEQLSIYNASVLPRHPLRGVRLTNSTKLYLQGGPITVFAGGASGTTYAGDAKIDDVPPGQDRLLSYAVDQEVLVNNTKDAHTSSLVTGSIVKGVLNLKFRNEMTHVYEIQNKAERERKMIIETPVTANYDLVEPKEPLEKTNQLYRFQTTVPAEKTGEFTVKKVWVRGEAMAILPMDPGAIVYYLQQGEIPKKVKEVLQTALEKKRAIVDLQRKKNELEQERNRILEEMRNVRENIKVLPANSKSAQDQIAELGAKDQALKDTNKAIKETQTQIEKLQKELEAYLAETTIE